MNGDVVRVDGSMVLVGDVHGEFVGLKEIIFRHRDKIVIQLGDLGIGFNAKRVNPAWFLDINQPYTTNYLTNFEFDPRRFRFIRGNHDNPGACRIHKNYLGEYGMYKDVFYISGAWSIDRDCRTEGVDWWADEELTIKQGYEALEMYKENKPDIVISHDCPTLILNRLHAHVVETRTGQLLDAMLREHKPKHWYFAHHHMHFEETLVGVHFRCLNCNEAIKI